MSGSFALESGWHPQSTWDASDNIGWQDCACWIPGRSRDDVASATAQPSVRLVHARASAGQVVLLDPHSGERGTHHRAPLRVT